MTEFKYKITIKLCFNNNNVSYSMQCISYLPASLCGVSTYYFATVFNTFAKRNECNAPVLNVNNAKEPN